jgi:hypothetical protein
MIVEELTVEVEDDEALEELIRARGWSDGLPVHVPTRERVEAFVAASGLDPEVVLGPVPPLGGVATVGLIAVNAVLAGCRPEHLPVVVAAIDGLLQEPFNLYMAQVTTNPVAPLAVVNGPARRFADVRHGRDALGPGDGGNGPIGRAIRFVLRNAGGIADHDKATFGSPAKYTLCIAEDEEGSPWEPLHVWQGYEPGDSVVTMLGVESIVDFVPTSGTTTADNLILHLSHALHTVGTNVLFSRGNPVVLLTPGHAQALSDAGIDRKALQERLFEQGAIPLATLPFENIAAGTWAVRDDRVLIAERPEDIYVVVAGAAEGHHFVYMIGCCLTRATHCKIELPG